jgi:hypothetical protein
MRAEFRDCASCGSQHIGPDCGMTFRQRLLSVRLGEGTRDTATKHQYYDDDVIKDQLQTNLSRNERKAHLYDRTDGYGYAETQASGEIVARDPKTHKRRVLSPDEVDRVYLSRGTQADPSEIRP